MESAQAPAAAAIADNLEQIRTRINDAAERAGRGPQDVTLVAVSKTHPLDVIEAAYAAGQRDFGENRLGELWTKVEAARARGLNDIRWHFVGTIQSRKTKQAIGPLALLHAVDRVKIAKRLSRDATEAGCVMRVLLEVNVSGDTEKHGFPPDQVAAALPVAAELEGVSVRGLMAMAARGTSPEEARKDFAKLHRLRDQLRADCPASIVLDDLSMGMSNDFEVAIEEGATIVRVGSALFAGIV